MEITAKLFIASIRFPYIEKVARDFKPGGYHHQPSGRFASPKRLSNTIDIALKFQ